MKLIISSFNYKGKTGFRRENDAASNIIVTGQPDSSTDLPEFSFPISQNQTLEVAQVFGIAYINATQEAGASDMTFDHFANFLEAAIKRQPRVG
ncbi:hypothetical protein [Tautonia rosea]|uniref:hypothetical protein n=1 Tax=Tautonia rosea TaxID=2728037 RepID=UPI001474B511|nr:hypothetical protein [Tautonia rosea]